MKIRALLLVLASFVAGTVAAQQAKVTPLFSKDLPESPGKEGLMMVVEYPPGNADPIHRHNAHGFIYVLEGTVATIAIQPIRKSRRLANVKIVKAIVVNVAYRQAVVAVHIDAACTIQGRAPVIGAVEHLQFVRLRMPKGLGARIYKNRMIRSADGFPRRFPAKRLPYA